MSYPERRPRRLRRTTGIRELVQEARVGLADLVLPLFVHEGIREPQDVPSMPGVRQLPPGEIVRAAEDASAKGLKAVILFGIPKQKDDMATQAYSPEGVVQKAVREVKQAAPDLVLMTDVCLCEYMSHGHCGIVRETSGGGFEVANDETLELLAKTAVSHAEAGAAVVAPSDMMDGRVAALRAALDASGRDETVIMSYAVKFSSAFYAPFREAAESAPGMGDRKSYQMDTANALEALREASLDVDEGADILMVKPGLPCLDILWRVKERFEMPTAVYNVSGEYATVKAAVQNGWLDERQVVMEQMTAFKRAGADLILTYWAPQVATWLAEE